MDFKYIIQTGDASGTQYNTQAGIHLRYKPSPLCLTSGCPKVSTCAIYANATVSYFRAILSVPQFAGSATKGALIPFANNMVGTNYTINPFPLKRNTSIQSIKISSTYGSISATSGGAYGPGTLLYIDVTFNDVAVVGSQSINGKTVINFPSLYLSVGRYANYTAGSSTLTLTFEYLTKVGDTVRSLYPVHVPGTKSAINCQIQGAYLPSTQWCITNYIPNFALPVDITTTAAMASTFPHISINSNYSYLMDVFTDLPTSPYGGYYTVGQIIPVYAKFNLPVVVTGLTPRIQLDFGEGSYAYAVYQPQLVTGPTTMLPFEYIVKVGDAASNLAFTGVTMDLYYGTVEIFRAADIPIMLANLTLPVTPRTLGRHGNIIRITTSAAYLPRIHQAVSLMPNGVYRAGDAILLRVDFTQYVVLTGYATLSLNLGDHYGIAYYVGVSPNGIAGQNIDRLTRIYLAAKVHANPVLKPNVTAEALANTTARYHVAPNHNTTVPTAPTKSLYFLYIVQTGDFSPQLDYVDTFAFSCGVNAVGQRGTLILSLNSPTNYAGQALPVPGTNGSIAFASRIVVDGTPAYVTGLTYLSPPGAYTVDITRPIYIQMNVSAPVVVTGKPYITLNTGGSFGTRPAYYDSGSGSASLVFRYDPQPGDYVSQLDYYGVRANLMSAANSFQLNGGNILVLYLPLILSTHHMQTPCFFNL